MDIGNTIILSLTLGYIAIAIYIVATKYIPTNKLELTDKSSLFLVSLAMTNKTILVPILISTNDTDNLPKAGTWMANGTKMGIQGRYIDNTYLLEVDPTIVPQIRSITYVSTTEGPPIPYGTREGPREGTKMYTHLFDTSQKIGTEIPLYGPKGTLLGGRVIEDPTLTYEEMRKLALGTVGGEIQGFIA